MPIGAEAADVLVRVFVELGLAVVDVEFEDAQSDARVELLDEDAARIFGRPVDDAVVDLAARLNGFCSSCFCWLPSRFTATSRVTGNTF